MTMKEFAKKIDEIFDDFCPHFNIEGKLEVKNFTCPVCGGKIYIETDHDQMNDLGCVMIDCKNGHLNEYEFGSAYRTYSLEEFGRNRRDLEKEFSEKIVWD